MRCLDVMKVTEILRLIEMGGLTFRQIGESIGCSKTTVGEINKVYSGKISYRIRYQRT